MKKYKVICIDPRQIADDVYAINEEYIVDEARINKYVNTFKIIEEVVQKKQASVADDLQKKETTVASKKASKVQNKDAGKTEDK